ncbi:MAG: hypothetical protein AB1393_09210 [Candidatus Edwardsbacteria bacterium]
MKEEFYKGMQELKERQEKTIDKVEKEIDKVNKMVGKMTDGWGKFVEGLVAPSIPVLFKNIGIKISGIYQRAERFRNGREMEVDLLCIGQKDGKNVAIATEVRSNLEINDVKEWAKKLENFFIFFMNIVIGKLSLLSLE